MSLKWPIPVNLCLVPSIVLDVLMICFTRFAYCGEWDVKVWHEGKPKSGYLSVSAKQEKTSLARKISRDPSSAHENKCYKHMKQIRVKDRERLPAQRGDATTPSEY